MIDAATRFPTLSIPDRRDRLATSCRLAPGSLQPILASHAHAAGRAAAGLFARNTATWSTDPAVQEKIANRLGWLDSPSLMADSITRVTEFADSIVRDQITDVVLLGMGGSSLAPEVLRSVLGTGSGRPRFQMLDSTDPGAVRAAETTAAHTLYILASKSGGTIEPNSMAAHFRTRLEAAGIVDWAKHFVAITDEGTSLAERARIEKFREVFINPSDIGGRYSALSYFGLVPAAVMGQDISALVAWGLAMLDVSRSSTEVIANPAVALGLALGAGAQAGRDKMTLIVPDHLATFGVWVEQLVAESTGKNGVGILPVVGEDLGALSEYGNDRLFVSLRTAADEPSPFIREIEATAAPVVDLIMPEPTALGGEFMRWEIATAIAGALLGINPFDEPNVQQAKDATRVLLTRYESDGRLPPPAETPGALDGTAFAKLLSAVKAGDYVAFLAYVPPDPAFTSVLQRARTATRHHYKVATTAGYGPRYLHSTGQLHKGGANTGVFVLISAESSIDVPIPGQPFSFGTLELAQAFGDFASLTAADRRALHIHLPRPDPQLLARALGVQ